MIQCICYRRYMSLSRDDLNKISNLVKAGNEYLESRMETRFAKFESRFSNIERKLENHDGRFDGIERKLDQLIETENEDVMALAEDIEKIKVKLKKSGI